MEPCFNSQHVTLFVFNMGQFPCVIKRGDLMVAGLVLVLQGYIPCLDIRKHVMVPGVAIV